MVHDEKLSAVLSEFARTMATDFPIQRILDHLVVRIVDVLPITGAGVTLISPGKAPRYVAASDASALLFERLQTELNEGPCLSAYELDAAVTVPDLANDDRFPRFSAAAVEGGLGAVFTFPLAHGDRTLGALDLYRDQPGKLTPSELRAAQTLADVAVAYLMNAQAREDASVAAEVYRQNSLRDPLTGLPNRLMLQQRLDHAADRAIRSHAKAAILFVDLDAFKAVNDTHGHQVGDELLIALAHRLAALVRPGDTLARLGGDEFVFLCEDLHSSTDVEVLANRIHDTFSEPFPVAGGNLTMSASVGVAFAGAADEISAELLGAADAAMYAAKHSGGRHDIVDLRNKPAENTGHDRSLERDLRTALRDGLLDVAYQPIVSCADGLVAGVEALIRWRDTAHRGVPAEVVIAVAERARLIDELGMWVFERACRDYAAWAALEPAVQLDLAVNVSARQLVPGFPAAVAESLARSGMDPASVVLELTEQVMVEDNERTNSLLAALRTLGMRLALDDFGTGYSSLSYLRRLPVDIVKLDRSFISGLDEGQADRAIVSAVAKLAHVLGRTVTAEGVESEAQAKDVAALGCDFAQGYHFSRPMPAARIAALLRRQHKQLASGLSRT